jgi:hypothetical protein
MTVLSSTSQIAPSSQLAVAPHAKGGMAVQFS